MSLLLLWLACNEPAAPPPPPPKTQVQPSPAPAPAPPVTVWTPENIGTLVPVAPTREGKVPWVLPANPAYDEALQSLASMVEKYAGDPENPWAVAHGLLARGKDFKLADGRPAIPQLFATYAEPRSIGTLNFWGFPQKSGEIRVEPHTDLLLKNMQEAGVAPDADFPHADKKISMADLYRYTLLKTFLVADKNKSSFEGPNDIPWGLQALATWSPGPELQWVTADGIPMDLDYLTTFLVAVVTQESAFMFQALQKGERFERSGQNLFNYTCGGAHLVQGASYAVARGFGGPKDHKAMEAQVILLYYRLPIELDIYQGAMARAPKMKGKLLVQQLKFLGHWLETTSKLSALGFYSPDATQQKLTETAAQKLVLTVQAIRDAGAFDNMETIRKSDEQLYLDMVGDGSHAIRGLELALGRGVIRY